MFFLIYQYYTKILPFILFFNKKNHQMVAGYSVSSKPLGRGMFVVPRNAEVVPKRRLDRGL